MHHAAESLLDPDLALIGRVGVREVHPQRLENAFSSEMSLDQPDLKKSSRLSVNSTTSLRASLPFHCALRRQWSTLNLIKLFDERQSDTSSSPPNFIRYPPSG